MLEHRTLLGPLAKLGFNFLSLFPSALAAKVLTQSPFHEKNKLKKPILLYPSRVKNHYFALKRFEIENTHDITR
jgi:hypothetical protein